MTGEGVGEVILGRSKRTPEFTEKNFPVGENIFSLAVFFADRLSQLGHAERTNTNNHGRRLSHLRESGRPV
jgi:hypothetical protein